jgi:hypothetical protein
MAALATIADLEARGVTVSPDETSAVNVYLEVASALVRDAADSPVSEETSTVTLTGTRDDWLRLPGGPVRRSGGWASGPEPSEVTVTYLHGLAVVPADIVDLVCRLAGQELVALRSGETGSRPLKTERIGDYSAGYDTDAWAGDMRLTDWQRERLAARFGAGAASVRVL